MLFLLLLWICQWPLKYPMCVTLLTSAHDVITSFTGHLLTREHDQITSIAYRLMNVAITIGLCLPTVFSLMLAHTPTFNSEFRKHHES